MRSATILIGMLICLFGPMAIFTFVGYKSLQGLSKRPTQGAGVMIALITKLIVVTVILVGILIGLLKAFAPA